MSRAASQRAPDLAEVVLLRGATLLRAGSLEEIATLGPDGLWRTPDGAVTDAIGLPQPRATGVVTSADRAAAHREQDNAWLEQALDAIRQLARERGDLTVDDGRASIAAHPRDPRQMSALMVAAQNQGLIRKTSAHRPSTRPTNGGRTVRVWRSLVHEPDGTPGRVARSSKRSEQAMRPHGLDPPSNATENNEEIVVRGRAQTGPTPAGARPGRSPPSRPETNRPDPPIGGRTRDPPWTPPSQRAAPRRARR